MIDYIKPSDVSAETASKIKLTFLRLDFKFMYLESFEIGPLRDQTVTAHMRLPERDGDQLIPVGPWKHIHPLHRKNIELGVYRRSDWLML